MNDEMFDENVEKPKLTKDLVVEYAQKLFDLENEIRELNERKKELKEEYKDKIDVKTFNSVVRTIKILQKVNSRDEYDNMLETLEKELSLSI